MESLGTDSQDSDDLVPPGVSASEYDKSNSAQLKQNVGTTPTPSPFSKFSTAKGIQNAKKRLRAFSIQKKTPIVAMSVPKPVTSGNATVLIGKLSSVKTTPKPEKDVDGEKKPPKPPKPGSGRKNQQDSYSNLQKRNIAEIEDMKRKMELVELGIPLGLICPSATSEKAMPTKAMPPIKSFLDPSKVDELIREAKKARAAGKEFKFDYQKLLPDYDNPFQRRKDEPLGSEKKEEEFPGTSRGERREDKEKSDRRKSDKYDIRSFSYDKSERRGSKEKYKVDKEKYRDEREKYRADKEKYRDDREKYRDDKEKYKAKDREETKRPESRKGRKDSEVSLSEYYICDSWSLDNDDKSNSSPLIDKDNKVPVQDKSKEPVDMLKENFKRKLSTSSDSPVGKQKIEKLKPVIDAYKFDLDPNEEEEALELYDVDSPKEKYSTSVTKESIYDSPTDLKLFEYDQDMLKESVIDANDDNFLESVINEIKQENMSDDTSQDNRTGLVEYDSPKEDDDEFKIDMSQGSVTPELDDRMRDMQTSQQSHYSDGYRSTESGYKSTESGYKSELGYKSEDSRRSNDFRLSMEKEIDGNLECNMSKSTVDSLETWSFVLKICQPLLFRHDKNKCYKETHSTPKLWYTVNPKACSCVKDRSVVYENLEMCKMSLVDRVYGCDQIPDVLSPPNRSWYPRVGCLPNTGPVQLSSEWETEEPRRSTTPQQDCLHLEYQRFIESVWPEVTDAKPEISRSTTPDKMANQESGKKKKAEHIEKEAEDKKKAKKMKLSSEGWSQESDMEEETEKTISKKIKTEKEKNRKRRYSSSISNSESEGDSKKKKKIKKKEDIKKAKSKLTKKRRISKKVKRKLKEKQKKKKKMAKIEQTSDESEKDEKEKKKQNKLKKKAQLKTKKAQKKKKAKPKSSSSSSSDSESEVEKKKIKKKVLQFKRKKKDRKRKRKESSGSTQSEEELFDVNILNNIKTERLTDDEKNQQMNDFSPRRQKRKEREIINVKELQNDFVGNNIHIKQEKEDTIRDRPKSEDIVKKIEINDEEKACEAAVDIKPQQSDNKVLIPTPGNEPIFPDASHIPLPDEPKMAVDISNSSTDSETMLEQTNIHLPADANIPLPAEIKVINIPEPSPLKIQETTKESDIVVDEIQNINYCNTDVSVNENELYDKGPEPDGDDKFADNYEPENYEMYERMAMAYQNDVANQVSSIDSSGEAQRIETVVRRRRGEIKCDWRAGDKPAASADLPRVSRWGLKPGEVNIVLTGGPGSEPATVAPSTTEQYPIRSVLEPVYKIESLANRHDNVSIGYDEAYQVTYGASDRLQYGDCFAEPPPSCALLPTPNPTLAKTTDKVSDPTRSVTTTSLDERIDRALRETVLGDVTKETDDLETDKDTPEKGILVTKSLAEVSRGAKRVSFADGYKPGQDSDVEEPPITRKKKSRRYGCAWPCPATHPDHVPLWDALPPPPPPPLPPTMHTLPNMAGTLPNLPTSLANIPGTLPSLPGTMSNLPGNLTNLPGSMSNLPGNMTNLPGNLSNLPGTLSNLPGNLSNIPVSMSNLPGSMSNLPGNMSNLPGNMSNLPGSMSNLPGSLSNLPGSLSNLPGSLSSSLPPMQLLRGNPHAMPRRPGGLGSDPSMTLPPFMPPEPPPGLISFQ